MKICTKSLSSALCVAIAIVTILLVGKWLMLTNHVEVAEAAPVSTYHQSLIPITDSTYYLGTTTSAWLKAFLDEICLNGDCRTAWPSGGGGGSDVNWSWNPLTNVLSSDGASTTATTTISTYGIVATYATATNATTSSLFSIYARFSTSTLGHASSTALSVSGNTFLGSLTGLLKGTSGLVSTASNGTDFTLITGTTCGGTDKVSAVLANGTVTCSADQTGGAGGSISTSSVPIAGNLTYWTSPSTLSDVATGTLTESVTGLDLSATRGLVGGSAILSLTNGWTIPTTSSTTEWGTFYQTPSTRITDGNALTWSGNTLNFDGGNTPSGDLGGTWASPSVTDDSHAHTGLTLSGIDISDDTNLSADGTEIILTGDALSLGTALTFTNGSSSNSFYTANSYSDKASTTYASTSALTLSRLIFGGVNGIAWSDFCTAITGGSGLCDGTDATGGSGGTDVNWSWSSPNTFISPATTTNGIIVRASSTIGDGTATGGLTVNGNATTSGDSTIIGTSTVRGTNQTINGSLVAWDRDFTNFRNPFVNDETSSAGYFCGGGIVTGMGGGLGDALRVGCDNDLTHWSSNLLGYGSIAVGNDTVASGVTSAAFGDSSSSTGQTSFSAGYKNSATGQYSIALGDRNVVTAQSAIAFGELNNIYGASIGIGSANENPGQGAHQYLIGKSNLAHGFQPTYIFGDGNDTDDDVSVAIGFENNALEYSSLAIGNTNTASSSFAYTIGTSNSITGSGASNAFLVGKNNTVSGASDRAFGVGISNTLTGTNTLAFGRQISLSGNRSVGFGDLLSSSKDNNLTIGMGVISTGQALDNTASSSIAFGMNSTIPTLIISGGTGAGTLGSVGIGSSTPSRLLTVGGDIYGANITATGTASSSALVASNSINLFGGGAKTTANDLCIQLTGSSGLCDGSDASGAGGSSNWSYDGTRLTPTTSSAGIGVFGSSTIGGGTNTTGLTVAGGATTTGDLKVLGGATTTSIFSTNASSTNLAVGGTFYFLGDIITNVLTWFDSKIELLSNVVVAAASVWDFGGAASLEVPNAASPTVDATGEIALDTTDDQLLVADGAGTVRVFGHDEFRVVSLTIASSSVRFASGKTLAVLGNKDGLEITQYRCYVDGGTSKVVNLTDGTNDTETITCGTTMTSDTDVATNDTFTADELGYLEMGATTGTVDYLHFEAYARITRE